MYIILFHEQDLRRQNIENEKLKYLNISVLGLSGRHHAALSGLLTVIDVRKSRPNLKMLVGNFYTYEMKSNESGGSSPCLLYFEMKSESVSHILVYCSADNDVRKNLNSCVFGAAQALTSVNSSVTIKIYVSSDWTTLV